MHAFFFFFSLFPCHYTIMSPLPSYLLLISGRGKYWLYNQRFGLTFTPEVT